MEQISLPQKTRNDGKAYDGGIELGEGNKAKIVVAEV